MLSKKSKYALKALVALARGYENGPVLITDLARKERIPQKFLEAILLDLKNHGVLKSKKGRGGGYQLRKSPREITFGQVIRTMEGPLALLPCVSVTRYRRCTECADEAVCGVRLVMKEVRDSTARILDGTTLADVLNRIEEAREQGEKVLSYEI